MSATETHLALTRVPLLGLGTFQLKDPATLEFVLRTALDLGYRSIGTSRTDVTEIEPLRLPVLTIAIE
jgi:diketogulonate reductase-like aldo/keto reductase